MLQFSTRSIELISLEQASPSVKIRVSFDKTGIDSTSTQDLYSQNSTFESDLIVVRIKVTVDGKKLKLDEELGLIETIRNWFEEHSKRLNLGDISEPVSISSRTVQFTLRSNSQIFPSHQSVNSQYPPPESILSLVLEFKSNRDLICIDLISQIESNPIHFSIQAILIPSLNSVGEALSRRLPQIFYRAHIERIQTDASYHETLAGMILSILSDSTDPEIIEKSEELKLILQETFSNQTAEQNSIKESDQDLENLANVIGNCVQKHAVTSLLKFGTTEPIRNIRIGLADSQEEEMIFEEDETRDGTESLIESDYESIEGDESRIQKLEVEEAEDETQETDFDSLHFNFFEDSQSRSNSIQDGVISDDIFVHEDEMLSLVEDEI